MVTMPTQTIRVNDVDLAYDIAGQGEPVLLIHGLGSGRHDWDPQMAELSTRHRVITYDVRGHGDSGKPKGPYSMVQFAEDAAALIRELALPPVHVVGLSLGGMIGFQLAVDDPELVRSLTIINSGPEVVPRTLRERLVIGTRLLLTRLLGPARLANLLAPRLFPKPEQERLRQAFVRRLAQNDRRAYLATTRAILGWSVADRLGEIACPVLVIAAERDYTPIAHKRAYVAKLRRARLEVIMDSGHATPWDQPRALNEKLLAFLAESSAEEVSKVA
jgi:pimeloyl-ACP methyl ester carboxylesterase